MSISKFLNQYGLDALSNHYILTFKAPTLIATLSLEALTTRVTSVDIPDQEVGTYTVYKDGQPATLPNGMDAGAKSFSFSYRVDESYATYQTIATWLSKLRDPVTGVMNPVGELRTTVTITPTTKLKLPILSAQWVITGAFPTVQRGISFEENGGDPITASVSMDFLHCEYPTIGI